MAKDFVNILDFTSEALRAMLERAVERKAAFEAGQLEPCLQRRTLAMVFEKPSLRTRVSFEAAMTHLGGHAIYLAPADIGLGQREPVRDVARVLGRMCDGIVARTFAHETVEELARHAPVPVINALSDRAHPCQAMADMMTIRQRLGDPAGRTLAFVGDGNNVARSLAALSARLSVRFVLACPAGYELDAEFLAGLPPEANVAVCHDPRAAVAEADVIYTDTWVSMGQEDEKARRRREFAAFQINAKLLAAGRDDAVVMHCLPAYRGCEITDEAFEAHAETVFEQAGNRLHFQRALLEMLLRS
ncbi:MAG: ornithine carbamoyltransferase [Phycisphaerae bacterium]|nr:ornithine carbamoyltransferase [Phycisphaerae bacterium]